MSGGIVLAVPCFQSFLDGANLRVEYSRTIAKQ